MSVRSQSESTPAPVVEAVSFDFFNTLVHHRNRTGRGQMLMAYLQEAGFSSAPWEHQVLYDVLQTHALKYDPAHTPEQRQSYRRYVAELLFDRLQVRAPTGAAADHADQIWELLGPNSLAVFPDVAQAIAQLQAQRLALAVISNWQCGLAHFCTDLGIRHYFAHIIASAEVGCAKPAPEIFAQASQLLNVAPERILHVGDTFVDDYEGASAAGFQRVLLCRDAPPEASEIRHITNLAQLPALIGLP